MLRIADKVFDSHLFTGTGKFRSNNEMKSALEASESELITVALKRVDVQDKDDQILSHLNHELKLLGFEVIFFFNWSGFF